MNNQFSFTSSFNFNQINSIDNQSQESSAKIPENYYKNSEGHKQYSNQHGLESYRKNNVGEHPAPINLENLMKRDVEISDSSQNGFLNSHNDKMIKIEETRGTLFVPALKEAQMKEGKETRKSNQESTLLDEIFQKRRSPDGISSVFYEYDPNKQDEEKLALKSLRDVLDNQCKVVDCDTSRKDDKCLEKAGDYMSFEYIEPNLKDLRVEEILGEGLHGVVIKTRSSMNSAGVIKLFEKQDEQAFINEAIILSNVQRAKEARIFKEETVLEELGISEKGFQIKYFQTDRYYGISIKAGLGSLYDFKEYLKKRKEQEDSFTGLSVDELLFITWILLDICNCLHEINHCHRDVKPGNIVFDAQTFLPDLIDYSLASEILKAQGNVGTKFYRTHDFLEMEQYREEDRQNQLISNDYFALGKTILEIAFPTFNINNVKDIKGLIEKLKKYKSKQPLAEILEICLFGNIQMKKNLLKRFGEKPIKFSEMHANERREANDIQTNSDHLKISSFQKTFKQNHFQKFQTFMEKKFTSRNDFSESRLENISSHLFSNNSQDKMSPENGQKIAQSNHEIYIFSQEEQEIKQFLEEKKPQRALKKCNEVIDKLSKLSSPVVSPYLYSTLMSVLYLAGSLEEAIMFGEKILPVMENNWIFRNNLIFLYTKRMSIEENGQLSLKFYHEYATSYMEKHVKSIIEDVKDILAFSASLFEIKRSSYVHREFEKESFDSNSQKEIILTFFEIELKNSESYFFLNCCYIQATRIDNQIGEETRKQIKEFVEDITNSERIKLLDFVSLFLMERVLLAILNFCKIFEDLPCCEKNLVWLLSKEAKEITEQKDKLIGIYNEHEFMVCEFLLEHQITFVMIGFVIHYNLEYNSEPEDDFDSFMNPDNSIKESLNLGNVIVNEDERLRERQRHLDSIPPRFFETVQGEYIICLSSTPGNRARFLSLLFFGKKLNDIILDHDFVSDKGCVLKIVPKKKLFLVDTIRINFRLSNLDLESTNNFFTDFNKEKLNNLRNLTLGLWKSEDENLSLRMLEEISQQLSFLKLLTLEIKMEKQISITDQAFRPISKFISRQTELILLSLVFGLSPITSSSLDLLADDLKNLQNLQQLSLTFKNCSRIERKSIETFLGKMKKINRFKRLFLSLSGCSGVKGFVKPTDLPYKLETDITLTETIFRGTDDDDEDSYIRR